ncbi:tannase/feruloyl esterase family alpha/beta hydrolase [Amycolatopsis sp. NPDC006131]|uniref:tannase/feruloyl esterase family alpha/beta hydrolase n=1 Tax=Amycolatopsis sp. NPDC006131 TaxID=3156731 RepID=UPI0033AB2050
MVRKLHDGAADVQGRRLEPAIAHEWGSELEWTLFVPATPQQIPASARFAESYLRHLAFPDAQDPDFRVTDLQFTVDLCWRTIQSSSYLAAMDPDLSAFRRGGGKLLLWHGWNDQHIAPQSTLAYWDAIGGPWASARWTGSPACTCSPAWRTAVAATGSAPPTS